MQGADPLKAALFDQVLHGQVILMGVDSNGLDVIEATGEVVDHCLVELRSIAVTSVVRVDSHPVDGNVVIGIYLPVAVQLVIGVVRRWNDGQGPDGFAVVGLGQVSVAVLNILADVVWVRVVSLPLVNPAFRQLVAPVLQDFHHLVKIFQFCFSNLHFLFASLSILLVQ